MYHYLHCRIYYQAQCHQVLNRFMHSIQCVLIHNYVYFLNKLAKVFKIKSVQSVSIENRIIVTIMDIFTWLLSNIVDNLTNIVNERVNRTVYSCISYILTNMSSCFFFFFLFFLSVLLSPLWKPFLCQVLCPEGSQVFVRSHR